MPMIEHFNNDVTVRAGGAPEASPWGFGNPEAAAAPGEALARAGARFSDTMTAFDQRYSEAKRAADTAHYMAGASETLQNLQHQNSLVPDRTAAQAGFNEGAATARKALLDGIQDPLVKQRVAASFDEEVIGRRYDTANAAFGLESNTRQAQLVDDSNKLANSAAFAGNDATRSKITQQGLDAIDSYVKTGWVRPEVGEGMKLNFKSQIQEVQARQAINSVIDAQDGKSAQVLADHLGDPAQFQGLLPERREALQQHVENLIYRLDMRAASKANHADAVADRNLRVAQAHNEATLLAGVNNGEQISDEDIQKMADGGQITAGGVEALHTARLRQEDGHDDPSATLRLWHAIGTKQASSGEIFDALSSGSISKSTSVNMMRALDSKQTKDETAIEKGSFSQLKSALHGGAVEQGVVPDKAPEATKWTQAQGEWRSRVTVGGEDPQVVLKDMLGRYASDTAAPSWLPQPKFGSVTSPQELGQVIQKTGQMFKAGKIDQAAYQGELKLLSDYKRFYGMQQQQQPGQAQSNKTSGAK